MISKSDFEKLLEKYLNGTLSPEEETALDTWYSTLGQRNAKPLSDQERESLRKIYWDRISKNTPPARGRIRHLIPWIAAIAASVSLIIVSLSVFDSRQPTPFVETTVHQIPEGTFSNEGSQKKFLTLRDGSVVILQPGSTLTTSASFDESDRKVTLRGEAYFEIAHNPHKPFYVFTNSVVTKVLGTTFVVRANDNEDDVTVLVKTGIVSVFAEASEQEITSASDDVVLNKNEQVVYSKKTRVLSRTTTTKSRQIVPSYSLRTDFVNEPIGVVFQALEAMYGFKIEADSNLYSNCKLTTTLTNDNLYDRLQVICEAIGSTYRVEGNIILIEGEGCD